MKSEELAPREGRCQSGHRNKRFGCGAAMVEFSNREQIERWLEQVQPARRQREVGAALAVRAALRVVPLLKAEFELHTDVRDVVLSEIVLRVFRATLISWFSVKYPREKNKFRAAAAANIGPSDPETALTPGSDFVLESVFAAFRVAEVPISDCITTVGYAVDQAIHAAAEAAAREGEGPPGAGSVSSDEDAEAINSGLRAVEVAGNPLWPTGTPSWAAVAWQDFKEIMLSSPTTGKSGRIGTKHGLLATRPIRQMKTSKSPARRSRTKSGARSDSRERRDQAVDRGARRRRVG